MNRVSFPAFSMVLLPAVLLAASFGAAQAAQTCNPNMSPSTPDSDFVDNGDGTVTHRKTGLMWSQCLLGQSGNDCSADGPTAYNWQQALEAAAASTLAGYNDWRLPNIKELASILELACYAPTINLAFFPNDPGSYVWSSSPAASYEPEEDAWGLRFSNGSSFAGLRSNLSYVRLVRGGQ